MTGRTYDRFPTGVGSVETARPGPTVDGSRLHPGDVLLGPDDQRRVVTRTGVGPTNEGVGVFDPKRRDRTTWSREYPSLTSGQWTLERRALAVETALGADGQTQYLVYTSHETERDRYRCEWGQTALGAMDVPLDGASLDVATASALCTALARPATVDAPLSALTTVPEGGPALLDTVEQGTRTVASRRVGDGTVPTRDATLWCTGVEIPTGVDGRVATVGGLDLTPGDRLLTWPDGIAPGTDPTAISPERLRAGACIVVLRQSEQFDAVTCYDITADERLSLTSAGLRRRYDRALDGGFALSLLARECFVDPVGTDRTYSVHGYHVTGCDTPWLLAVDAQETATPRLEHPLALHTTAYTDVEAMVQALGDPQRLADRFGQWASRRPAVRALCERVADRVEETVRSRESGGSIQSI